VDRAGGGIVKKLPIAQSALHLRIWLARASTLAAVAVLLLLSGSAVWLWQLSLAAMQDGAPSTDRPAPATTASAKSSPVDQNFAHFQALLGSQRDAELQVKMLFRLAEKHGLALNKGLYKSGFDQNGKFHTYQIEFPVKGTYSAIWQFATQALAGIPFASLDDISFKRDSVADGKPEARLRFTLYLEAASGAGR
jgi:hypothetical protein